MSRRHRLVLSEVPLHIIQRGNNRLPCFFVEADYMVYLDLLRIAASATGCKIHAYVLMTNHVHLLISPVSPSSAGALMKSLGERYVQYVNRRHRRTGTLWEGRFRSCVVQEVKYLFACHRYIELNPVRANMVTHPSDYRWSSYQTNAHGQTSPFLSPHDSYVSLASVQDERECAYRALFEHELSRGLIDDIRAATNQNSVFGTEDFVERIEVATGQNVRPRRSGRRRD